MQVYARPGKDAMTTTNEKRNKEFSVWAMLLLIEAASPDVLPPGAPRLLATWIARFASYDGTTTVGLYRLACGCGWQQRGQPLTNGARVSFWRTLKKLIDARLVRRLDCTCPDHKHDEFGHLQLVKETLACATLPTAHAQRDRRRRVAVMGGRTRAKQQRERQLNSSEHANYLVGTGPTKQLQRSNIRATDRRAIDRRAPNSDRSLDSQPAAIRTPNLRDRSSSARRAENALDERGPTGPVATVPDELWSGDTFMTGVMMDDVPAPGDDQ
jgi:hypothetical protein